MAAAAAQAAAANGQNSNYLQMAAAANRLFTPYLIEQQTSQQMKPAHFPQPPNPPSQTFNQIFHSPHKRRRTKVTDTRLSPRNPLARAGLLGMTNGAQKSTSRDESPVNDDEQEDNEFDDESQVNQEDDSVSSGCNESGSTAGSNQRLLSNTTNNNSYAYDMNSESAAEYPSYHQISFLNNSKNCKINF